MKVLALDYGSARTGVAVSDPTGTVARPVGVVERAATEDGLARLAELVRAEEPERIVVGLLGVADALTIFISGIAPLLWPSLRDGVDPQVVAVTVPFGTPSCRCASGPGLYGSSG